MALAADELTEIEGLLAATGADAASLEALRRRFPKLAWMRCDASDVTEQPFRRFLDFDLHLIDGSDHCVHMTADPAKATGMLLARRNIER
ncbi:MULTISPECIES: DUF6129 family protein [unclassified Bradyrhizobium]|uniref:DUF6129 family protein n=1 Tax=unclassified Bradyrhizobium TaxID=2631580 RepID=UPI00247A8C37|nr:MULTISPECIES: DUF6129 family protein [unclassified Bradyrhizobium]WGS19383.1 DUF6129 family protein [Bradyrhizobium sp. ISRA463]WGS26219.1 DUF6129 family protein [Bradyrhizobium sp. ISRA464]